MTDWADERAREYYEGQHGCAITARGLAAELRAAYERGVRDSAKACCVQAGLYVTELANVERRAAFDCEQRILALLATKATP